MTKQELRKIYLEKRKALSEAEYLHLNRLLCDHFFAGIDLSFVKVLHSFLPIVEKKEPDTWLIINRIQREFTHIRISIPKMNTSSGKLEHYFFEGPLQLKKNSWEIDEPGHGIPTPVEKIDIVLVPLLAFDNAGHRIGYGKGFYDRFLAECRNDCKRVGISLFPASEFNIPATDSDFRLTHAITPMGGRSF
jgi:5-formyltetrahydrofolate cyclo-ligase